MTCVRFDGWEPGFDKIAQNRLLRERAGMGLREAKDAVDRIVAGEPVIISTPSPSEAARLVKASRDIGAQCAIVSELPSASSVVTND